MSIHHYHKCMYKLIMRWTHACRGIFPKIIWMFGAKLADLHVRYKVDMIDWLGYQYHQLEHFLQKRQNPLDLGDAAVIFKPILWIDIMSISWAWFWNWTSVLAVLLFGHQPDFRVIGQLQSHIIKFSWYLVVNCLAISILRLGCCTCPIRLGANFSGIIFSKIETLGTDSISHKMSHPKMLQSFVGIRPGVKMLVSRWNFAGALAAGLARCLQNFRAIWKFYPPFSRLTRLCKFL